MPCTVANLSQYINATIMLTVKPELSLRFRSVSPTLCMIFTPLDPSLSLHKVLHMNPLHNQVSWHTGSHLLSPISDSHFSIIAYSDLISALSLKSLIHWNPERSNFHLIWQTIRWSLWAVLWKSSSWYLSITDELVP